MSDEVEQIAEEIYKQYPVTVEGVGLDWDHVNRSHPERAAIYRDAARNRLREAAAMRRLNGEDAVVVQVGSGASARRSD